MAIIDVVDDEAVCKASGNSRSAREPFPLKDHPLLLKWDSDEDPNDPEVIKHKQKMEENKRKFIAEIKKDLKAKGKASFIIGLEDFAIGDAAQQHLKMLTGQDFKKDKDAWKKWIEENPPSDYETKEEECLFET